MDTIVSLKGVKKEYMLGTTKVDALRGVSLDIIRGEFSAISGPSGSGKSTILNLIGCIDHPTEGEVFLGGTNVTRMSDKELTRYRRHSVSFIFQSFNLIPVLNVYENIELPLLMDKRFGPEERKKKVMHLIEEVGLSDRIKNKPSELSGGQRQRVAIARALVVNPILVLADEPTANLDTVTGQKIIELMKEINKREGTSFLFSTHDAHVVSQATRVVEIRDGLLTTDRIKGA